MPHPGKRNRFALVVLAIAVFHLAGVTEVKGEGHLFNAGTRVDDRLEQVSGDSLFVPLFDRGDILEITLTADLRSVFSDNDEDRPYRPASFAFMDPAGETAYQDIKIKTRGEYRRLRLGCDVPPIKLNFKKGAVENTLFSGQDKIKLVTHCRSRRRAFEQFVLEEYLVYKTYNILTDSSFQVRLARITYEDTAGERDPVTRYGFLIEDEDLLAERLGEWMMDRGHVHPEDADRELMTLLSVFQYMIGNTDWNVPSMHNIRLVFIDPKRPPLAVPYDFDMSGMVAASYASPNPKWRLDSVRERLFLGYCRSDEKFSAVFNRFNEKRDEIYALWRDFELLERKYRDRVLSYLDSFYDTINSPRRVRRAFLRECQTR